MRGKGKARGPPGRRVSSDRARENGAAAVGARPVVEDGLAGAGEGNGGGCRG